MKTLRTRLLLLAMLAYLGGCSEQGTGPSTSGFNVEGVVLNARGPMPNVSVDIDRVLNWTTTTDANGHFKITGVTQGAHAMTVAKSNPDGSFSERKSNLVVTSDLTFQSLVLPTPVTLENPTDVQTSQVRLMWHPSDAADFREYKLYRKGDQGLDETTGELAYVATSRTDTTFVDTRVLAGETYYYRVFVMNDLGRLGGSNLVSAVAKIENLIPDGGFEVPTSLAAHWEYQAYRQDMSVTLDSTVSHAGKSSLHVHFTWNPQGSAVAVKLLDMLTLRTSTPYELSFYMKVKGQRNNTDDLFVNLFQGQNYIGGLTIVANNDHNNQTVDVDWAQWKLNFSVAEGSPVSITFIANNENVWLDDVTLVPLQ